ncbi:hypothetical protein [Phyllobacterium sp. LjRoot231]|uniref:hypothetical protein n=1 Tax=Phyllobacterium sp. LjRoot231 TaxID=3342289 RepID=UPI003F4FE39F
MKKRLKLASVAPSILKAYRADKIDLEQVMAYTLSEKRQEALFRRNPDMNAYQVRQTLTEGDIPLSDKRVTFSVIELRLQRVYQASPKQLVEDLIKACGVTRPRASDGRPDPQRALP